MCVQVVGCPDGGLAGNAPVSGWDAGPSGRVWARRSGPEVRRVHSPPVLGNRESCPGKLMEPWSIPRHLGCFRNVPEQHRRHAGRWNEAVKLITSV